VDIIPYVVDVRLRFTAVEDEKELISLKKDIERLVKKHKKEIFPVEVQYKILQELAESID
jgi:hypothetical protein